MYVIAHTSRQVMRPQPYMPLRQARPSYDEIVSQKNPQGVINHSAIAELSAAGVRAHIADTSSGTEAGE